MIRRPPRSTLSSSSAASDVYKRQIVERANNGDEDNEDIDEQERIKFEEFQHIAFKNKGLPDILFLAIQLVYGVEVCDAYCNSLGIKLFRPYNKDSRLILNRMHPLSSDALQKLR
eukprot:TRINITY_DN6175_c0_g1_i5.p1 TRINITY_DN6175_c0_g1~~TRINITY_DN6175_c0_g1_i5.p1  ORF type:complete len:123 (+),score=36.92 TRINITY_DN6175_c0_g1_i5:27-371(+)